MTLKRLILTTALTITSAFGALALASDDDRQPQDGDYAFSKEQAVEMALMDHPGQVEKAYLEHKRGQDLWEVKIDGDDGKEYEVYYDANTGEHVKTDIDD